MAFIRSDLVFSYHQLHPMNFDYNASLFATGRPIPRPDAQVVFPDLNDPSDSPQNRAFVGSCFLHLSDGADLRTRLWSLLSAWKLRDVPCDSDLHYFGLRHSGQHFECHFCTTSYKGIPQMVNCIKDHLLYEQGDSLVGLEGLMEKRIPSNLSVIPDYRNCALGGIAAVYAGVWGTKRIAIKVLKYRKGRKADIWEASNERRVRREIKVWAALKHRNIQELLGYSEDFSDYPAMISPWCQNGTALDYLEGQKLPVNGRMRMVQDVSEGLKYLHELNVIHGDLKPNNILIDDNGVAKLCDFGLIRLADWHGPAGMTTTSPYTGTTRYKAPELFSSQDNSYPVATFEGDIYALGCVMLEFIEQIYSFQRFVNRQELISAIIAGYPPALRSETTRALSNVTEEFWNLLEACWAKNLLKRPAIWGAIRALDSLREGWEP